MKVVTRILTGILLTAVAVLVFAGVVYPFYIVPKQYEDKATELTMARVEAGGIEVDPGYITESINEAMTKDLDRIFKEALLIAAAAALILFCLTIRPPHDHGGINLFNPIYLVPVAGISLLTGAAICLILSSMRGAEVNGFLFFVKGLTENYEFTYERLLLMILIPIGLELIFRGVIFSFIEKLHFSLAIVVSTVMYAFAAYYIVGAYTKWSLGSNVPGMCAFWIALGIGGVHAIVTWRLRSVIPAVLSHLLLVFSAGRIAEYCAENSPSLALVLTLLGVLLLALVLLPTIFGKKVKVLAYDFPLTKHHERMYGWLYGRREKKAAETETKQAEAVEEAEKKTEEVTEAVEKKAEEAAETVEEKAEEVTEAVEEKAEEASEAVEEKAEEATEAVGEKAEEVAEAVEEKAEEVTETVEEKAEEVAEAVEEKAEEVTEAVEETVEEVKDSANE